MIIILMASSTGHSVSKTVEKRKKKYIADSLLKYSNNNKMDIYRGIVEGFFW